MLSITRFPRAEFSLFHLENWRRLNQVKRLVKIRYSTKEAIVIHHQAPAAQPAADTQCQN